MYKRRRSGSWIPIHGASTLELQKLLSLQNPAVCLHARQGLIFNSAGVLVKAPEVQFRSQPHLAKEPIFTSCLHLNNKDKPVGRGNLAILLNELTRVSPVHHDHFLSLLLFFVLLGAGNKHQTLSPKRQPNISTPGVTGTSFQASELR